MSRRTYCHILAHSGCLVWVKMTHPAAWHGGLVLQWVFNSLTRGSFCILVFVVYPRSQTLFGNEWKLRIGTARQLLSGHSCMLLAGIRKGAQDWIPDKNSRE